MYWTGGFVSDQTMRRILEDLAQFEGRQRYLYLDSVSTVTVGIGTALPERADIDNIVAHFIKTGLIASSSAKREAWNVVQNVSHPRGKPCSLVATHFESLTEIVVHDQEIDRLVGLRLAQFYLDLVRIFPGFDSMPEPAKISLFDMIYNLGPTHLEYIFVHFTRAIRLRDWTLAASQCVRPQVSRLRNFITKERFQECAKLLPDQGRISGSTTSQSRERNMLRTLPMPPPPQPFPRAPYHAPIPHPLRIVKTALIRPGDRGTDVRTVQNAANRVLIARRPPLVLDGHFGPVTATAIRAVQSIGGLTPHGVVGPATRTALALILA